MSNSLITIYDNSFSETKISIQKSLKNLLNDLNNMKITSSSLENYPNNRFHRANKAPSLKIADSQTMATRYMGSGY